MRPFLSILVPEKLTLNPFRNRNYLAQPPELGQQTMSDELTALIAEVLTRWEGPTPRLCYVTDAGDNETAYYRKALRPMPHPRTGQRLEWQSTPVTEGTTR